MNDKNYTIEANKLRLHNFSEVRAKSTMENALKLPKNKGKNANKNKIYCKQIINYKRIEDKLC